MEDSPEEPPTSCVLLDSCHFSQVLFHSVEKFYVPGADVTCHYTLSQNITPRGKDWVGIFRVGWKTTREYYTFLWAPVPASAPGGSVVQQQIQFKAYYLPKDDEYYQFLYVDQDGMVRGASVPFQFRAETEDDILVVTTQGEVEEIELQNKNLQKEKQELEANCANLWKQNLDLQEKLKKTQELQNSLESLRSNTGKLELELNSLKMENKQLKEQGDCREAELQQLRERIQDVTSDKEHLEGELKTALDHVDQLQSQVRNYEQEVEDLSGVAQAKAKQLGSLKEENHQLLKTTAQQQVNIPWASLGLQGAQLRQGTAPNIAQSLENPRNSGTPWGGSQQNQEVVEELKKQKRLFEALQAEKSEADKKNQVLRRELSLLQRISLSPAVLEAPAPTPAPEAETLLFGNPYCGEIPWHSVQNHKFRAASLRKCPMCGEAFAEDFGMSDYEAHVQSHLLECPICSESFDKANRQVFDDHVFCHGLE
ncbi:CACO2 protein, partial [Menura novaehollandiae]|nr:CACO2 protein [Menura novaehollandiae]